jgi:hypothetical protein
LFSLARPGSVLHSDAAKGFIVAANMHEMHHMLCSKHYHRKIESLHKLLKARYKSFKSRAFDLIYRVFPTEIDFNSAVSSLRADFADDNAAIKVLDDMVKNRDSLCASFTQAFYTAGHRATQRVEGFFANVRRGTSKRATRRWQFLQLLLRMLQLIEQYSVTASDELRQLMLNNKSCCSVVEKAWREEQTQSSSCRVRACSEPGAFTVDDTFVVTVANANDPNDYARCSCSYHTSSLQPCRHICKVESTCDRDFSSILLLHPRWRIQNHPLFVSVMQEMKRPIPAGLHFFTPARVIIQQAESIIDEHSSSGSNSDEWIDSLDLVVLSQQVRARNAQVLRSSVHENQAQLLSAQSKRDTSEEVVDPCTQLSMLLNEVVIQCQRDADDRSIVVEWATRFIEDRIRCPAKAPTSPRSSPIPVIAPSYLSAMHRKRPRKSPESTESSVAPSDKKRVMHCKVCTERNPTDPNAGAGHKSGGRCPFANIVSTQ